jgi:2-dehydro-3-deoxyphosphogluconate aldolase/(4S)-4-hydroxy-2-oxoglutarate aldolase
MNRSEVIDQMHQSRLVAVVRSKTAEEAMATAKAALQGGVKFIEITFSVPGALDVIKSLAAEQDLHVGAGTVLSSEQAKKAIGAGARFVVAPSLELNLVPICHEANVPCIPGAATPTEIITAARAKADLVKIFPADTVGGPYFIRQMFGPFPEIRFMVSGGVTAANVKEYVQVGVTGICLGSAYLASTLSEKGHDGLVNQLRRFVELVEEAQALK